MGGLEGVEMAESEFVRLLGAFMLELGVFVGEGATWFPRNNSLVLKRAVEAMVEGLRTSRDPASEES